MYYVWTITNKYPQSYWIQYDWEDNPNYLQFLGNKKIDMPTTNIIFKMNEKISLNSFLKHDYVMSDAVPLISNKFASLIIDNKIEGLQLIPAAIYQKNVIVGEYYIPIFLDVIDCIDNKKSVFDKEIEDYTIIVFKPNSLDNKMIVKAKGYNDGNPIVQKDFVRICSQAGIKGVDFYNEPYINPLYSD